MLNGSVKWFNTNKGYGFIIGEDNKEVFVHWSGIDKKGYKFLEEGNKVTYDLETTDKGVQAIHVKTVA